MITLVELMVEFVRFAKSLRGKYVEAWLDGEVNDLDMDMALIDERNHRATTYNKFVVREMENKKN